MHAIIRQLPSVPKFPSDWEQGFVDQYGNFMTREEAWEIAQAAGQIRRPEGGAPGTLYSEHLY
jgi:hypothetical protein